MTESIIQGAEERQQCLLDEFATQVVLAGDAGSKHGTGWLAALKKLVSESGAATRFTDAVAELRNELASLQTGSEAFFSAAETGIEKLGELIHGGESSAGSEAPAASGSAYSMAQDPELVADFVVESREHLRAIEQNVLAVEQDRSQMDPIHAMFRAFHTIKGIAGFLEFQSIRDVSHETETLLDLARNGKLELTPGVIDVILESADYLNREITRIESGDAGDSAPTAGLIERITHVLENGDAKVNDQPVDKTLSILSEAMVVAETPMPAPLPGENAGSAPAANAGEPKSGNRRNSATTIKVDTAKLDFLVDAIGEMTIAQSLVRHHPDLSKMQSATLMRNIAQLSRITSEVQKTAMSMRMVPVGTLFQKMARLVRDLSPKIRQAGGTDHSGRRYRTRPQHRRGAG